MNNYVVKVGVSYVDLEFKFASMMGACNFMETFLNHAKVVGRNDEMRVWMEREEKKGEE